MSLRAAWQMRWQAFTLREQRWLLTACGLVSLALVWWVAMAPALAVLKTADAKHRALGSELQQMQRLQAQAQALQALPSLDGQETRRALEASLKSLGTGAQLAQQMDRVTVTLKGANAQALAQWLSATRQNAHVVPTEARLKRTSAGGWDGTVVFTLVGP